MELDKETKEECCCPDHDHEHEHHHEHHHDHDHHDHVHEHEEGCTCEDCVSGVSVIHHEGALAGSFSIETDEPAEHLDSIITDAMLALAGKIDEAGGIIGHIKAAVASKSGSVMYSITLDTVNKKGAIPEGEAPENVSFASIVFGVEEDMLRPFLVELKESLE